MSALTEKIGELIADLYAAQAKITELERKTDNRRKLFPEEVGQIRRLAADGMSYKDIAGIYAVNRSTISRTVSGDYHAAKDRWQ